MSAAATGARFIGRPVRRREDLRILRGESRFLDDLESARLAHVAFVRSPHAHARITACRLPRKAEGLLGVFSAAELGDRVRPFPVPPLDGAQLADEPHPVLAAEEVRYVGQPVVAVVAESRALAEDAAELVEIDYEALPAVVDARLSDLALLRFSRRSGDVEGAFADAAHVVRGRYALPRLVAAPIETRGCVVEHDAGRDLLTVWCSAQDPHRPLFQLSHILGRGDESIRVIVPDVGGAFGGKGVVAPEVAAVAVAAMDLRRPLKWAEDRLENFLAAYQGRGMEGEVELALDATGRMLAVRARLWADLGAYLLTTTHIPPHTTAMLLTGCYDIPAAEVELVGARTHKVPTGPYRGAGRPEAAYLLECAVDDAARQLGVDPIELRRRNLVRRFPHRTPFGWTYDSGDYARCLERAVELVQPERRADAEQVVGTGVALCVERGGGMWESADVTVEPSGRVVIRSSSSPHGQGHDTTFAQIAAERLGLELDDIVLRFGDSALGPRGVGTFASRSVAMAGSALVLALDKIAEQMLTLAAHLLGVSAGEVSWRRGEVVAGERSLSFRAVAAAAYQPGRQPAGMEVGLSASSRFSSDLVFSSGAYAAVVAIERATGRLRVLRLVAVDDVGNIINPLLVHGQVLGGAVQALGECLVEEVVYDEDGQLRTASFMDYHLLTAAEIPPITLSEVTSPSPLNPLGAKGAGEGGAIGTLPAVANAVADALGGIHLDPPFDEEKLWRTLHGGIV
jgi:aerobic carbon-monoxide dehydrogenase large subunit